MTTRNNAHARAGITAALVEIEQGNKSAGHTPGPWYTDGNHINAPTPYQGLPVPLAHLVKPRGGDIENQHANARLIAAAPELLAALQAVLSCPAMNEDQAEPATVKAFDMAMSAIAKARGQS